MHVIHILLHGFTEPRQMRFKAPAAAALVFQQLNTAQSTGDGLWEVADDYGVVHRGPNQMIALVTRIDLAEAMEGDADHQMLGQRTQAKLQQRVGIMHSLAGHRQ